MSETSMEYNMDQRDELLLIDLHAALQADIQKAWEEAGQCKQVIMTSGLSLNPYLHDAYVKAADRLETLIAYWSKRFPGEPAIRIVMAERVMQE
jgi:hypothetical protein